MELLDAHPGPIDLSSVPIHLGIGSVAGVVQGFGWDPNVLAAYASATEDDGIEGRMIMTFESAESWSSWERHPAGDEVVICLSGSFTVIRDHQGATDSVTIAAGQAMINPAGVWHTVDVHERGEFMTITPGAGTEHRARVC
jgi:mannose-6-phosphate isomerase-like protein (cupin superfamily)